MDVGIRSVYSNYDNFERLVEGAVKLSIACFSNLNVYSPQRDQVIAISLGKIKLAFLHV